MALTVQEIAARVGGVVAGDGARAITGLAGLSEAGPAHLSFLSNPRYAALVAGTRAGAVIVNADWSGTAPCALIRVPQADRAFTEAALLLAPPAPAFAPGVHPTAVVAAGAILGEGVSVGPHCVIEPGARIGARSVLVAHVYVGHASVIGEDCRLYPFSSLRERVTLGHRVILHNGAVIGSDGFGYYRDGAAWRKIPQVGTVEIGDDVEIGANTTVDRARFGKTVIAQGVKLDNLVQIAHNVKVGAHTAMAAQAGVSGSSEIGAGVQMGGQSGVAGHLTVGDGAIVGAQSGVSKDVPPRTFVLGAPAMPHDKMKRMHAHILLLPALREKLAALERRLGGGASPRA